LEWLLARGEFRHYALGAVLNAKMTPATAMVVLLEGHVTIRVNRGTGAHKIVEWRAGDVTGALPYSRGGKPPDDAVADEHCETFEVPREIFPEMIRECPMLTARLVHVMLDRVRVFTSADLRDEKLVALGKLAAGLAHELNNPASAATRAAKGLAEAQLAADAAARRLGALRLNAQQLAALDSVADACRGDGSAPHRTALERSDREEELSAWLKRHRGNESCVVPLAETSITLEDLDALAAVITGAELDAALCWLATGCASRALAGAVEISASRISEIVNAVKGFTYMDQAPNAVSVDLRRGIQDAITMLNAKVRAKAADIAVELPADLPAVRAVGAELNQVWLNLLDNALDAIDEKGRIRIAGRKEPEYVIVEVIDNGAGIPAETLWRIFEPFYTTKGVGKGTGLGLDIVRRLLQRQDGGIDAESAPGRTAFKVFLPIADTPETGGSVRPEPRRSSLIGPHSD
jgi:signal transduction histidine kinase